MELRKEVRVAVNRERPDPLRKRWTLNQEAFDKLLAILDRDRDRAGEKYQAIRASLLRMFECRGCRTPEQMADETIDRVSRRIEEGETVRAEDPTAYFYGVARHVLKEYFTNLRTTESALGSRAPSQNDISDPSQELLSARLDCLEGCVAQLPQENREIIIRYYSLEKSEKIADRRDLARALGLSPEALRMRAVRIRRILETCVDDCMKRRGDLLAAPERPK
jgi:DNA-directed RNA polymerase specialized sigma24 family protein